MIFDFRYKGCVKMHPLFVSRHAYGVGRSVACKEHAAGLLVSECGSAVP